MIEPIDAVVVGAGIAGLAIARALAMRGREVLVLEKADVIGAETSSRNSQVLHAGIYYPPGSLKAKLCVKGRLAIEEYAPSRGVPMQRCGKLIVAQDDHEAAELEKLLKRGYENGVDDLRLISAGEAQALEPALKCDAALYSPSTAIIDSHALMLAYQGDLEAHGGMIAFKTPVVGGDVTDKGIVIETGGPEPGRLICDVFINAAGFGAPLVAENIKGSGDFPQLYYAKGCYFELAGACPFSRLIYPAPETWGLGVHLTFDLAGRARFGPDVEWVDDLDYTVDPARGEEFYTSIRRYWPGLKDASLHSGYAGIRPKLVGPGQAPADFRIDGPKQHGVKGLVHLFGIESPGLTSSLAIADLVCDMLGA